MNVGGMFSQNLSQKQLYIIRLLIIPFKLFLLTIDYLYPKNDKLIIFGSYNGKYCSGCPKALFEFIKKEHPEYFVSYYLPFKKENYWEIFLEIVRFFPIFFNAKFIVSSHPSSDFIPYIWWSNRKIFINTYHGIPFKAMLYADSSETNENLRRIPKENDKTSYYLVASKLEASLISYCLLLNPRKFCYLGHPKNDILLKTDIFPSLSNFLGSDIKYNKVVLYCPTFRHGKSVELFPFNDYDSERFNLFLENNGMLILMRTHAYSLNNENLVAKTRIINFGFDICEDIYSILSEIDCIITDYSSIFIDYLLVDKPIIFLPYDLEAYKKSRGLLFDDYEFWTPGYKVESFNDFLVCLNEVAIGTDKFQESRRKICKQFHYHQTSNSCENIFNFIIKKQ
ncbi:CDP-glycerol glycerophosphotransferase family protein [Methanospirillum sp.]